MFNYTPTTTHRLCKAMQARKVSELPGEIKIEKWLRIPGCGCYLDLITSRRILDKSLWIGLVHHKVLGAIASQGKELVDFMLKLRVSFGVSVVLLIELQSGP